MKILQVLLTLFIVFISSFSQGKEPLIIAYGHDYRPFAWEEQGEMKGLQVDIIKEALEKRLNIPVIHRGYPWKRAQRLVQQGEADALFTVATAVRRAYTQASKEVFIPVNNTLFTYSRHSRIEEITHIKSADDLKGYQLVDYIGGYWSEIGTQGLDVYRVSELSDALNFLAKKRADIFVQNAQVVHYNIKKLGVQNKIIETPVVLGTSHHRLLIQKTSPFVNILPALDKVVREMKKDGTMKAIYDRYK